MVPRHHVYRTAKSSSSTSKSVEIGPDMEDGNLDIGLWTLDSGRWSPTSGEHSTFIDSPARKLRTAAPAQTWTALATYAPTSPLLALELTEIGKEGPAPNAGASVFGGDDRSHLPPPTSPHLRAHTHPACLPAYLQEPGGLSRSSG
jgi:hypothetical protein